MNTCPKCGDAVSSEETFDDYAEFECGSLCDGPEIVEQSRECLTRQRDALLARVEALEKAPVVIAELAAAQASLAEEHRLNATLVSDLQAAQARIAELEREAEADAWKISPAMAQAKIDELNRRIAELSANQCEKEPAAWLDHDGILVRSVKAGGTPLYRKVK
jgi:hypothetical protein